METQTHTPTTDAPRRSDRKDGDGRPEAETADIPRSAVQVFLERVAASSGRTAMRHKVAGQWQAITWAEWDRAAREVAVGLMDLGVAKGDRVCVLGATRVEWAICELGIQMAGGVTVPIYPTNIAEQCEYVITDSGAKVVIAENPAQLAKLFSPEVAARLAHVRIVYWDARCRLDRPDAQGRSELALEDVVPAAGRARVRSLDDLRAAGRGRLDKSADDLVARRDSVGPEDVFTIVYTSGTTGNPKGVVLTHRNICFEVGACEVALIVSEADEQLLFLPLAHIFARILLWAAIRRGCSTAYAEGIAQLGDNMKEVRPTFIGSVPRIYEKVYAKVVSGAREAGGLKEKIFDWAMSVGGRASQRVQRGQPVGGLLGAQNAIADRLVFSKLKAAFGGRLRFFISGGAPLGKEIAEFFHAAGILILEGYGLTETTAATHVNRPDRFRFGTVGPAIPGVEIRIAADGEILARGPNILREYFNKPEATREAIDEEGWFHTGDIGVIEEGFLRITDRKKDIIVTSGGKNIAPQNLENQLKTLCPLVSQVLVHGDRRPYLVALVTLGEEPLAGWARDKGVSFTSLAELTRHPTVRQIVADAVKTLNDRFAASPEWSIKRHAILDRDFSQEEGEITPTLKVKRKVVGERFRDVIDGLYSS